MPKFLKFGSYSWPLSLIKYICFFKCTVIKYIHGIFVGSYAIRREYEKNANKYIKNHGINLIAFMKSRALTKLNSNTISKAQYTRICNTIGNIEKSELIKIPVKKIKDIDIQKYLNSLIGVYSDVSISKIYGELRQTFEYLYNLGFIKINSMLGVIKPKSIKETEKRRN